MLKGSWRVKLIKVVSVKLFEFQYSILRWILKYAIGLQEAAASPEFRIKTTKLSFLCPILQVGLLLIVLERKRAACVLGLDTLEYDFLPIHQNHVLLLTHFTSFYHVLPVADQLFFSRFFSPLRRSTLHSCGATPLPPRRRRRKHTTESSASRCSLRPTVLEKKPLKTSKKQQIQFI